MPHPLMAMEEETASTVVSPEVVLPPLPPKMGNGSEIVELEEGTTAAVVFAKRQAPAMLKRLVEIALKSPNHNAGRSAARDVLQVGGLMTETTKIDVVLSFRAVFAKMTMDELSRFQQEKVFPDRLREEALKLLEHHTT